MKAQYPCVTSQARIPNPSCDKCGGSGFWEISFPNKDDVAALWVGRCPLCGASNGCQIQRKGEPDPQPDPYWRCVNKDCERPQVTLVRIDEVTEWLAVCPICSTIHYADFLQRPGDAPPTIETYPRICPGSACGSLMAWVLAEEVYDYPEL